MKGGALKSSMPLWLWGLAILPRVFVLLLACLHPSNFLQPDSYSYLALARSLWAHRVFSMASAPPYVAETFRVPGYPLFLSPFLACFSSPYPIIILTQSLLGIWTVSIFWQWLEPIAGRRAAAMGSAVLALDWVTIAHTPIVLAETLMSLFIIIAAKATWEALEQANPLKACKAGFLWSLSAFIKPITFYLPLVLCGLWFRSGRRVGLFLLAAYLLPSFWILRNARTAGVASFSTIANVHLLKYTASGIESLRTHVPYGQAELSLRSALSPAFRADAYDVEKAASFIARHPVFLLELYTMGAMKTLSGSGLEMVLSFSGIQQVQGGSSEVTAAISGQGTRAILTAHPALVIFEVAYLLFLAATYWSYAKGLHCLWKAGRKLEFVLFFLTPLYFLLLSCDHGYYRFRIPMMPFLAAGAVFYASPRPDEGRGSRRWQLTHRETA